MECNQCVYQYSCGYSSLRRGKETDKCCEPHLFKQKDGLVWSYKLQGLYPEQQVKAETAQ